MTKAREKARPNGNGSAPVAEAPPALEGVFIQVQRDEAGNLNLGLFPQGDVRATEILSILEKATAAARANLIA